jgi:predicted alpha/beta hydrolase family esterase
MNATTTTIRPKRKSYSAVKQKAYRERLKAKEEWAEELAQEQIDHDEAKLRVFVAFSLGGLLVLLVYLKHVLGLF